MKLVLAVYLVIFCYKLNFDCILDQVIKEQPSRDVLVTTVVYRADDFGRVKIEKYVQTRLPDRQITLDYSEDYETHSELAAPVSHDPSSNIEDETEEDTEHSDSQPDAEEEEVLTEEEKKGLHFRFAVFCTWHLLCMM